MTHKQNRLVAGIRFTDVEMDEDMSSESEGRNNVEELESEEGGGKMETADPEDGKMKTRGKKRHSDGDIVNTDGDIEVKTPCKKRNLGGNNVHITEDGKVKTSCKKHYLDEDHVNTDEGSEVKTCRIRKQHSSKDIVDTEEDSEVKTFKEKKHLNADIVNSHEDGHSGTKTVCKIDTSKKQKATNGDGIGKDHESRMEKSCSWIICLQSAMDGNFFPQQFKTSLQNEQLSPAELRLKRLDRFGFLSGCTRASPYSSRFMAPLGTTDKPQDEDVNNCKLMTAFSLRELIAQKREAWLNRVSGKQQQKEAATSKNGAQAKEQPPSPPTSPSPLASLKAAENQHDKAPSPCTSPLPPSSLKAAENQGDKTPLTVSPVSQNLAEKLTVSPKPSPGDGLTDQTPPTDRPLNDLSNLKTGECGHVQPPPKSSQRTAPPSTGTAQPSTGTAQPSTKTAQPSTKTDATVDESGDGEKNGTAPHSQTTLAQTAPPKPQPLPKKSADQQKLKTFLEKAFNCTLTLTGEISRMRFSGGKMRVPPDQFPTSLEDLEEKMKVLVHQAFDKQINKVKFSINAYNACESHGCAFNDKMVDLVVDMIQKEAVSAVLAHFHEESESNVDSDAGLWDSYEGRTELFETYSFLPRLVGSASDNVNISPSLLSQLLSHEKADCFVTSLLHAGGFRFFGVKRLDEMLLTEGSSLQAMTVLVSNPHFGDALAKVLAKETEQAMENSLGNFFQKRTALSVLLSVSTIPESSTGRQNFQPSRAALEPFTSLRSFPRLTHDDVATAQVMIQKGIHELQGLVYTALKRVVTNKSTREVGLSWLATLISLNELRTSSVMQDNSGVQPVCSDGFMLNLCSVLLEFFLPIGQSLDKLENVDVSYSASPACRLNYDFEACLAGGQIVSEKGHESRMGSLPTELQGQHSFITECFHLTQRALSVTVIPAIKHYNKMHSHFNSQLELIKGSDREEAVKDQHMLVSVVWETCLLDADLVRNITTFYISQARILLNIVKNLQEKHSSAEEAYKAQKKTLCVIPEFCVKDMAQWFTFLAYAVLRVNPNAANGLALTPFVDCCVLLLERPDLMPGPVPASMIVSALLAFMKDADEDQRFSGRSGWGSGIMSDLAAMVHTCPSAQTKLGPALLRTYVSVDVVEGLDVDRDTFDKFSARVQIGQLVAKLWSRADCRSSIIKQCGTELFQSFLDSILDTLLYMLHDSLSRLANVKKIETLKANEEEWNALSKREQAEKDLFLRNEEHVGSGFMRQSKKTFKFLTMISQSEKVVQCFTRQPLASRAASTINGFLDSLCGAKAKRFKVKDMAKYDFNPVELLLDIVNIILRITVEDTSRTDGYLVSMVKDPDFELANLEKAQSVIISKGVADDDTVERLAQLLEQIRLLAAEHNTQSLASADDENNWRDAFVDLEIDEDELEKQYVHTMQGQRFGVGRIQESHCFDSNMQGSLDSRSAKVKALMKEMRQLTSSLPVSASASIFVRQDKDRMDVMRALVTGPTGTPYSLGCFCFDIYFPTSYPNVPPLVKIITTGNGTVRFNPNLYADGKVCLSLLGTWHAGDATEKWTPGKSSLYQVLVSIQSMILTADPVFNEPGYERIQDTEEGEIQSQQYNWKLHLHTLRHAILGQLRNPPPGFERVVRLHFALQREAVLRQCAEWVKGCEDPDLLKRLRQAADAIFEELMSLEVDFDEKEVDSEDEEEDEDD